MDSVVAVDHSQKVMSQTANAVEHAGESVIEVIASHLSATIPPPAIDPHAILYRIPEFNLGPWVINLSISKLILLMWLAAVLTVIVGFAGRRIAKNPLAKPSRLSGFIEVFVLFIRDDIVKENMGTHGLRWTPYFISLFFFILFSNLIGMFPGSLTVTGNVAVTAALSLLSFLLIQLVGMLEQGWFAYWKNIVPMGVPWPLWFIMWPIEFFGLFTKPFALTIRLFANMTAGHVVIVVLLFMIFQFNNIMIAPLSVLGALAINLLEVFICLIQAYIFVALSALFVGSAMHRH